MKYEVQEESCFGEDRVFILKDGRALALEVPEEEDTEDDGDD